MSDPLYDGPRLEFAFAVTLRFKRMSTIADHPAGGVRSAVYVDDGYFEGPRLKGKAVPSSGGDYAMLRPDDTAMFDARYMLQEEDGTLIYLQSRGYLWGRKPDVMNSLRRYAAGEGPAPAKADYYFRTLTLFETPIGKHDWLARHAFTGFGERRADGNHIRYYQIL
ncbi:MAG: DUF3237 domain-containing protein [Caulobacterales bacterium]